jgi:AraC-like DNA-binding protein
MPSSDAIDPDFERSVFRPFHAILAAMETIRVLCVLGLLLSFGMSLAVFISGLRPGARPPFLSLVFLEAAAFFAGSLIGSAGGFLSAMLGNCASLIGLPSLYLYGRSIQDKPGRRALFHYLPFMANLPLGFAMSFSPLRGGLAYAAYYCLLTAAHSAQLITYGRSSLGLARNYGSSGGPNWFRRVALAVISGYALFIALSWAIILEALAEEMAGRRLSLLPWLDPLSGLAAFFLVWTLGLCLLWGGERASADGRVALKYGGRPMDPREGAALLERTRSLLSGAADLSSPELSPRRLAVRLKTPYYVLSRAVNEGAGMSVLDLANSYRVERAKVLLLERPEASVLEVCYEAGFQSKSTFNDVFRNSVGLTPRAFRARSLSGKRQ